MYKIIIADDDEIICSGLQRTIDWASIGGEVVATANDGEEALTLIQKHLPDLAILDINMPFSDGLSVAETVARDYPKTKIIILSAYKEFSYAQKAFRYNVFNYLSKPCDREELLQSAKRAFEETEKDRYAEKVQRTRLFSLILHGETEQLTPADVRLLGLKDLDGCFVVAVFEPEMLNRSAVALTSERDIHAAFCFLETFFSKDSHFHLVSRHARAVVVSEILAPENEREFYTRIAAGLKALNDTQACSFSCGVSKLCHSVGNIQTAYRQALDALEYRNDFDKNHVISIDEITEESVAFLDLFKVCEDRILRAVADGNSQEILDIAKQHFVKIDCMRGLACSTCASLCVAMLFRLYRSCGDERLFEQFLQSNRENLRAILSSNSFREIGNCVCKGLGVLCSYTRERQGNDTKVAVVQAMQYVRSHFAEPELNLQDVADAVHISASYLQALLKKYEHTNFSDYLNAVRMEAAMTLLKQGNSKIYEVAFCVGLNSSQYFSRKFKKYFGIEPRQVRKDNEPHG